ncbi:helix-turn-helix domain-containing protein [Nonomuraea sp. NPDC049695]|uniref:TetR/AcrR family transcriptional regulator n=1 Tax=Nonomuraea sp. NPDC049695 TaxID=3154734 RepID=UPI0034259DEF
MAPRADAIRNRAGILRAARKLIAERGPEVGMDEIAAEAGVAVGTLYRHFPTKVSLVSAAMAELADEIVARLDAALARIDAGGAALAEITALLRWVALEMDQDRALREAATNLGAYSLADAERRSREALGRMVEAAQRQGDLYADVTVDDLALLMTTMPGTDTPPARRERWLELSLRGLTRQA